MVDTSKLQVIEDADVVGIHREYTINKLKYIIDLHKDKELYNEGVCEVRLFGVLIAYAEMQCDCSCPYQLKVSNAHGFFILCVKRHIMEAFLIAANENTKDCYYYKTCLN